MKKGKDVREGNKRHLKYFSGSDDIRLLGIIMMAASGILFLWIWYMMWSYVLYILMFALLPVGFVLFLIGSIGKSTEEDIDGVISRLSAEVDLNEERDADIIKKQLKKPLPEVISGYDYSDGLMFRKAKNGIVRSEVFKKATLIPLEGSICVLYATVNILCESVKKEYFEIPYDEIEEIRVVPQRRTIRFGKKSFSVNDSHLEIISHGNTVLSLPAKESATLDSFISELSRRNS